MRCSLYRSGVRRAHADDAEGADRLRQDPLRRVHGLEARQAADHPGLQRGHDRLRPGRAATCSMRKGPRWEDGPLTLAVRYGAICYLDEVVEARQDTTVVIHPLTDARRMLAAGQEGRAGACASRLPAGDLVQPGLPEHPEGPEAVHPAALRAHRLRLSCARRRDRDRRARVGVSPKSPESSSRSARSPAI